MMGFSQILSVFASDSRRKLRLEFRQPFPPPLSHALSQAPRLRKEGSKIYTDICCYMNTFDLFSSDLLCLKAAVRKQGVPYLPPEPLLLRKPR